MNHPHSTHATATEAKPNAFWRAICSWWTIRIGGPIALAWFLIRVIPKPSRATYPCQRAAFPIASGFVIWITSSFASAFAWRKSRTLRTHQRWTMAAFCLLVAIAAGALTIAYLPEGSILAQNAQQPIFVPSEPANSPMGMPFGIKPGRVAWAHDAAATTWDGTTNTPGWWDDNNTHPQVVAAMLSQVVQSVGDASTDKQGWDKIFVDFNRRHDKGEVGYRKGEKLAIKLNLNQCRSHGDNANASYIAPQLAQAIVRQLVQDVGVAPADITCYDVARYIPSTIYDHINKDFPGVHFVDSVGGEGREKAVADMKEPLYLGAGGETMYFPTCLTQADYLINVAGLKGHTMAGITVTAKNHLGSILTGQGAAAARLMHPSITVRGRGTLQTPGSYNGLVDLNGHKETGGKTLLFIVDALYASKNNEYRLDPSCKWESAPFNKNWTASLLASQDGVAIDSVALDLLRNEPTVNSVVTGAVDNYLHGMALAGQPSSKTSYDPEKDGKKIGSLGVHEHWNNPTDKKYSRNLGTGAGIELITSRAAIQ